MSSLGNTKSITDSTKDAKLALTSRDLVYMTWWCITSGVDNYFERFWQLGVMKIYK